MAELTCIESYIDEEQNHCGCFLIEPLEIGQAITLGNSLRRTLLSDLTGLAMTGVRINDLKHEFDGIKGVREDALEILLNLKQVIFKDPYILARKNSNLKVQAVIDVQGPLVVTAGLIKVPKEKLLILNPEQYICTLVDTSRFFCEIDIQSGKGYNLVTEIREKYSFEKFYPTLPFTLHIDANFNPIVKVDFKIKLIHDTYGNIKESLFLEIATNGSISPYRSLQESAKGLFGLLLPIITNSKFLDIFDNLIENEMVHKISKNHGLKDPVFNELKNNYIENETNEN